MRHKLVQLLLVALLLFVAACAHSFSRPTGLPADVHDRFSFHMNIEAQERGLRTARGETGVTVYADGGRISYAISGDEILATFVVPNKSGANKNYYNNKRRDLEALSNELIEGARKRAQSARDFAY